MTRLLCVIALVVILVPLALGCAPAAPSPTPSKPSAPAAATTAPQPAATTAAPATAAPTTAPAAKVKRGGILRVGNQNDIGNLDPQINNDNSFDKHMLFNTMVDMVRDAATGKWNPRASLAESWEVKDKTFTFKLRKGVKFHDGSEWNAEVFKFNIERMQKHPKSAALSLVAAFDTVEVVDPYTARLNLKFPYAPTLAVLSQAGNHKTYMVSKVGVEKWGEEFTRHPVGTGPMQFDQWKPGDQATFKKFDGYFEMGADGKPLPYLDGVVYRFIADDTVRLLEIKAGNLDAIDIISAKDIPSVKGSPDIIFDEKPWQGNLYKVAFNMWPEAKTIFLDNKKLRQAAAYGIDRDSLAKVLGMGAAKAWQYPMMENQIGYDPSVFKYPYDPAKAKQLLAEAGYPNGVDAVHLVHQRALDQQQAQMLKQMWDAIGFRTELEVIERIAVNYKVRAHTFDFYTLRGGIPIDPDFHLGPTYTKTGTINYPGWMNDNIEKCVEEGRSVYDEKQRHQIYVRCQGILQDEAVYLYNWFQMWNDVISAKVKGWEPDYLGFFLLRGAWIDK